MDEDKELDAEDKKILNEFETVNQKGKEIEFDKVQLKDLQIQ